MRSVKASSASRYDALQPIMRLPLTKALLVRFLSVGNDPEYLRLISTTSSMPTVQCNLLLGLLADECLREAGLHDFSALEMRAHHVSTMKTDSR